MFIINITIFIIRYLNVAPSILNQAVLKNNTKYPQVWTCSGSWVENAQSKAQFIKNGHNFQRPSLVFYSSAMLMCCNNPLKENLLTSFQFIWNISFLCPQGWAVTRKKIKNPIFLSFSDPVQVEQALAPCPPTFIPDVTLANLSGCNQATMGKRALLAWGLETEEKQIGGCLESSTYFGFPISFPSDLYYFCNGNWELVSGLSLHTQ